MHTISLFLLVLAATQDVLEYSLTVYLKSIKLQCKIKVFVLSTLKQACKSINLQMQVLSLHIINQFFI